MKSKEIRELTKDELVNKLKDLKTEFFNLRFQLATGQLNNPTSIRFIKKDIARIKTILREMELNQQVAK
ncbi:MAG: 50S ribosomal protein L29 [Christensenellaceae bacterium]